MRNTRKVKSPSDVFRVFRVFRGLNSFSDFEFRPSGFDRGILLPQALNGRSLRQLQPHPPPPTPRPPEAASREKKICSSIAIPIGSRSARIVMSAREPRCQGLTFWHPPHRARSRPNANIKAILVFISGSFDQAFDFLFVLLFGFRATETGVGKAHFTLPIDKK
jgi:hypothetical protein